MIHNNSELMQVLVESKQAELRHSGRPLRPNHTAGAIRAWTGRAFIRLGERIGGTERIPAPTAGAAARSLATP